MITNLGDLMLDQFNTCQFSKKIIRPFLIGLFSLLSACQSISNPLPFASKSQEQNTNADSKWNQLQHTSLNKLINTKTQNPSEQAWVDLAIISKKNQFQFPVFIRELQQWQQQNPNHPGNALIPSQTILQSLLTDNSNKQIIAVLLPLSGTYQSQGIAIKNGLLSAQASEFQNIDVKNIQFFDTAKLGILNAYQSALSISPKLILGPLLKNEVLEIKNQPPLQTPILALNYSDTKARESFYEFGLSPNDESQQMALHASQQGLFKALLIAPNDIWGKQQEQSLVSAFNQRGGKIQDVFYFNPKQNDFNKDIANFLKINAQHDLARSKGKASAQVLENQIRKDFDVVFLIARDDAARAIVPQLRYYYVQKTPIYAMSASLASDGDSVKNVDLENIIICDIPWQNQGNMTSTQRFNEVGYDALIISQNLQRLSSLTAFPLYAHTGALSLNTEQQIRRRVPCAPLRHGELGASSVLPE